MTEKRLRTKIVKMLVGVGAFAVENSVLPGTPDVCCTLGWIELKLGKWPKTNRGRVNIDLRTSQRVWMKRWSAVGGRCWTLTFINSEFFLHKGVWAADNFGDALELEFRANAFATWTWDKPITRESLIKEMIK